MMLPVDADQAPRPMNGAHSNDFSHRPVRRAHLFVVQEREDLFEADAAHGATDVEAVDRLQVAQNRASIP
jgi:hypothetical protein